MLVIWIVDRVRRRSGAASNVGATDQKWSHPGVLEPYTIDTQNRALDSQPAAPEALSLEIVTRIATYEEPRGQRPMPAPGSVNGAAFEITYADADGVITERVIRVQEVRGENGFTYIDAHCFLADAKRTFRGDRILSMKNHRTGEQIRDPSKFFAMFYDEEDDREARVPAPSRLGERFGSGQKPHFAVVQRHHPRRGMASLPSRSFWLP